MNEVVQVYVQDIKEKKTIGRSAYSRPNRSKVLMPCDLIKDRKYARNGKVVSYNMYDTIIPKSEFINLPTDQAKAMMERWRRLYSNREIAQKMGISTNTLWRLCKSLGITERKASIMTPRTQTAIAQDVNKEKSKVSSTQKLNMILSGTYSGEALAERLMGLAQMVKSAGQVTVKIALREEAVQHEQTDEESPCNNDSPENTTFSSR